MLKHFFENDPDVISDTHFFHDNVFNKFEPVRQTLAKTRVDFDEKMLARLRPLKHLLHLGDVVIDSRNHKVFLERIQYIGEKLKDVQKILIMGNHDLGGEKVFEKTGWIVVDCGVDLTGTVPIVFKNAPPFVVVKIDDIRAFLSHEPVAVLRPASDFDKDVNKKLRKWFELTNVSINIHGHVHSHSIDHPSFKNVSLEVMDFRPKKLSEIVKQYSWRRKE